MPTSCVYLDNQSTTQVDPRVAQAMVELMVQHFGNAGSTTHRFGADAREAVEGARQSIADCVGANAKEIVFTSGATESTNLAIRGLALHPRRPSGKQQQPGQHVVALATEHKAALDPLARLEREGFKVTLVKPDQRGDACPGRISVEQVAAAMRNDTFLVCVMLANNEIGVIQPLAEIGSLCRERGALLFTDAAQAVGKLEVNFKELNVDLASFCAHKMHGPKGVGALYIRSGVPRVRLAPLVDGGGQEMGLRSGTLNVPGIVGLSKALELSAQTLPTESKRLRCLRDEMFAKLTDALPDVQLNGPALDDPQTRLVNNLNVRFPGVDGEALLMNMPDVAVSSGSACTSASLEPSHVLQAIGLSADEARSSVRISFGRFNTPEEVDFAVQRMVEGVHRLQRL